MNESNINKPVDIGNGTFSFVKVQIRNNATVHLAISNNGVLCHLVCGSRKRGASVGRCDPSMPVTCLKCKGNRP